MRPECELKQAKVTAASPAQPAPYQSGTVQRPPGDCWPRVEGWRVPEGVGVAMHVMMGLKRRHGEERYLGCDAARVPAAILIYVVYVCRH